MRQRTFVVLALALAVAAVSGCVSYPSQVLLDPDHFENDSLRIDWAIGIDFFRLKIANLSDAQADFDLGNSAVISVDGQARTLAALVRKDGAMIPPRSYIVLAADQGAIFGADIYGRFNAETEEKYPVQGGLTSDDRMFLKSHSGQSLRLYLTGEIKGRKTVLDLPFRIRDVYKNRGGQQEQAPAAPPPAQTTTPTPKTK